MTKQTSTPFFMTHHAPVGAFASLTFGLTGRGISVDLESPGVEETADLIVAVSHGEGRTRAMPFASGIALHDNELIQTSATFFGGAPPKSWKQRWSVAGPDEVTRTLTPCVDEFVLDNFRLRVLTPHPRLPDPEKVESSSYAICPAVLLELVVDNSGSKLDATGFLGLGFLGRGRISVLDHSSPGKLCGVGLSSQWALAALPVADQVFTIRDNNIAEHVENGLEVVHNGGQEGGIGFRIPAGETRTLTAAFGFYREGTVTQGIEGQYLYTRPFKNVREACHYLLTNSDQVRSDCAALDAEVASRGLPREKFELFGQSVRAYDANTQVIQADGKILYNVGEGQYLWRNTMDLAADHLPWELGRNPWVVRNILEQFLDRYTYRDQVRFADEPGVVWPGGLSFTHDMGNFSTFSPAGESGYEMADSKNYGFMTTEELLNGIYCLVAYALSAQDSAWAAKRLGIARELLESLEQRDHHDPALRNGLLRGESVRCGTGREITTYDCLDHALVDTNGNLYIATKTFCSALLLAEFFRFAGQAQDAARAQSMADKTRSSLGRFYDKEGGYLKANLYASGTTKVIAAIEPFAVPLYLGLKPALKADPVWNELLENHVRTCLVKGNCVDAQTDGLRLSSTSTNTWPSKSVLCIHVMEELCGIDVGKDHPWILRELLHWTQVSAAKSTISDQIDSEKRTVIGAFWYPRIVTSAVWVMDAKTTLV